MDLQKKLLDKDDPWSDIVATTYFAVQTSYHMMLQATLVQILFELDMILNTSFVSDWDAIRIYKIDIKDKNHQY